MIRLFRDRKMPWKHRVKLLGRSDVPLLQVTQVNRAIREQKNEFVKNVLLSSFILLFRLSSWQTRVVNCLKMPMMRGGKDAPMAKSVSKETQLSAAYKLDAGLPPDLRQWSHHKKDRSVGGIPIDARSPEKMNAYSGNGGPGEENNIIGKVFKDGRINLAQREKIAKSMLMGQYSVDNNVLPASGTGTHDFDDTGRIVKPIYDRDLTRGTALVNRARMKPEAFLSTTGKSEPIILVDKRVVCQVEQAKNVRRAKSPGAGKGFLGGGYTFGGVFYEEQLTPVVPNDNKGVIDRMFGNHFVREKKKMWLHQKSLQLKRNKKEIEGLKSRTLKQKKDHSDIMQGRQDRKQYVDQFRSKLKEYLTKTKDPMIGVIMRYVDQAVAWDILQTYKGYTMSMKAVVGLVGQTLGNLVEDSNKETSLYAVDKNEDLENDEWDNLLLENKGMSMDDGLGETFHLTEGVEHVALPIAPILKHTPNADIDEMIMDDSINGSIATADQNSSFPDQDKIFNKGVIESSNIRNLQNWDTNSFIKSSHIDVNTSIMSQSLQLSQTEVSANNEEYMDNIVDEADHVVNQLQSNNSTTWSANGNRLKLPQSRGQSKNIAKENLFAPSGLEKHADDILPFCAERANYMLGKELSRGSSRGASRGQVIRSISRGTSIPSPPRSSHHQSSGGPILQDSMKWNSDQEGWGDNDPTHPLDKIHIDDSGAIVNIHAWHSNPGSRANTPSLSGGHGWDAIHPKTKVRGAGFTQPKSPEIESASPKLQQVPSMISVDEQTECTDMGLSQLLMKAIADEKQSLGTLPSMQPEKVLTDTHLEQLGTGQVSVDSIATQIRWAKEKRQRLAEDQERQHQIDEANYQYKKKQEIASGQPRDDISNQALSPIKNSSNIERIEDRPVTSQTLSELNAMVSNTDPVGGIGLTANQFTNMDIEMGFKKTPAPGTLEDIGIDVLNNHGAQSPQSNEVQLLGYTDGVLPVTRSTIGANGIRKSASEVVDQKHFNPTITDALNTSVSSYSVLEGPSALLRITDHIVRSPPKQLKSIPLGIIPNDPFKTFEARSAIEQHGIPAGAGQSLWMLPEERERRLKAWGPKSKSRKGRYRLGQSSDHNSAGFSPNSKEDKLKRISAGTRMLP